MDTFEPNQPTDGAELLAAIIRRRAAEVRKSKRDFVVAAVDNHGLAPDRAAEMVDDDIYTVMRFLAVDGKYVCTECHYGLHARCLVLVEEIRDCECAECRT